MLSNGQSNNIKYLSVELCQWDLETNTANDA